MVKIDDLIIKIEDNVQVVFTEPERDVMVDALILYKEMN